MVENSKIGFHLHAQKVPIFPGAVDLAQQGTLPGGSLSNREYYSKYVIWESSAPDELQPVFYDAQTSGGLLISVEKGRSEELLGQILQAGVDQAAIVGEVVENPVGKIVVS